MIGFIRGRLVEKKAPLLLVDVAGIGYEIEVPLSTLYELPNIGQEVALKTHLLVREDAHTLFGFASEPERSLFRNLLKISGVGARLALAILSGTSVDGFVRCVEEDDTASLIKIPGVGKKTAERLVMEMRDRLRDIGQITGAGKSGRVTSEPADEAFGALVALGYKPAEVTRMIANVDSADMDTEELIRQVLKQAAR
ncbi:MAG: Holliday junction branch migration protein RuvA [Gammaproteobacteria bacterium]|nr:Holliday junction branch migration protein RuvA [Gammaproteobacteria bacterium]